MRTTIVTLCAALLLSACVAESEEAARDAKTLEVLDESGPLACEDDEVFFASISEDGEVAPSCASAEEMETARDAELFFCWAAGVYYTSSTYRGNAIDACFTYGGNTYCGLLRYQYASGGWYYYHGYPGTFCTN